MKQKLIEIRSVLLMECTIRFRRSSTPILFLILCGAAFLLMPEVSSGGVMFLVGKQRVLLNSAATSLTSALMGGLVFSLVGFYLISNSVERDLQTGVGKLIAATPLSSLRYLAGKLFGNIVYLTAMASVFMIACMGMHVLRGEVSLEPMVFVQTFGIMFLPSIPCLAAIALMFECVPFFSGRVGDIMYFFFWVVTLVFPFALASASKDHAWILAADFTGLGFFGNEINLVTGAHSFTIGFAPFNAALSPILFPGLRWLPKIYLPRLASVLFTIPFFLIAWAAFQRFDPARRSSSKNAIARKITRLWQEVISFFDRIVAPRGGWFAGPSSLVKAIALDVRLTFALYPIFFLLVVASVFFSILVPMSLIRSSILPIIFFILVPFLASISTRDRQKNTVALIFSAPFVRERITALKFFSALFSTLLVGCIPLVRMSLNNPFGAVTALNAMLFMVSVATFLGFITGTPKTFIVLFLLFLYTASSSRTIPAFDFAGLHSIVTPAIVLIYTAVSIFMLVTVLAFEKWRMNRGENL
jgi:hypothetical protein